MRKSEAVDSMFTRIEPVFQSIRGGVLRISDLRNSPAWQRQALVVILRDEPSYLRQMNDIVSGSIPKVSCGCGTSNGSSGC